MDSAERADYKNGKLQEGNLVETMIKRFRKRLEKEGEVVEDRSYL